LSPTVNKDVQERFEDGKGAIISRKSKEDKQYKGTHTQTKNDKQ